MRLLHRTSLLLVLAFTVSLPAVTPRIYASDEVEYFSFLRSLWFDHDLSFDNEYRHFADAAGTRLPGFRETFLDGTTVTGHRRTFATIGCALLWAPFYAAADVAVRLARLGGSTVAADGYSRPYVAAVAVGSAFYGLLALLLSVRACRLIFGPGAARPPEPVARGDAPVARIVRTLGGTQPGGGKAGAAGGLATLVAVPASQASLPSDTELAGFARSLSLATFSIWLGTPLVFYMYVAPPFAHATSAFAVAAFVVTWLHVRRTWSLPGTIALGALAALMTMVREQDVLFAGGVALDFAWAVVSRWRSRHSEAPRIGRLALSVLGGLGAAALVYVPQAIAYIVINGSFRPSPHVSRKMTWTAPHAWQVLASPENGWLFWTPVAALALAGLGVLALSGGPRRRVGVCLLAMAALQVYVCGSIESWTVAGAFGQRRFVALTPLLVVGLAALLQPLRQRKWTAPAAAVLLVCAWWNVALIVQFGAGLMDRQRLNLPLNAYNAFVLVPRDIPRLVYRYVFDRRSFYAAPPPSARGE